MKAIAINAQTNLYCIFGRPVGHSFSPLLHNAAFRELGINAVYLAFEPRSAEEAVQSMKSLGILGASVTIPFKIEALDFVDSIDPVASDIGSVNTLHNINGNVKGYNTDGSGAVQALTDSGINIADSSVLVIGNGGSARAVAFTLIHNKARVCIAGRNLQKIKALADDLKYKDDRSEYVLLGDLTSREMENFDIIINTTPVGMHPDIDSIPIHENLILKKHRVFDIIYNPHMTRLLQTAEDKGATIIHGIDMLINQGVKQFEIWTGAQAPVEIMKKVIEDHLKKT